MKIAEFEIDVEYKSIKNIHLTVYPPDGRMRISVPEHMSEGEVSLLLYSRLDWLREKAASVNTQERQTDREFVTGENHYLFGERYLLKVIQHKFLPPNIKVGTKLMEMYVRPGTTLADKQELMFAFYRFNLRKELKKLIAKWAAKMGEDQKSFSYSIVLMQKQWGSCSTVKRKIIFNLLLARVPIRCVEYIVVHELIHLKVHQHNQAFTVHLKNTMPDWKARKKELDEFPALPIKEY